MDFYIFTFMLLLILFLLIGSLNYSLKAPKKIKILSLAIIIICFFRYTAVAIMFFSQSIKYLYYLKPFYFSYILCIPVIALICVYVFGRIEKTNFTVVIALASTLLALYTVAMTMFNATLQSIGVNGYSMKLTSGEFIYWIYLSLITIAFFFCLALLKLKKSIKLGLAMTVTSSLVLIVEFLIEGLGVINLTNGQIIGELCFIITFFYLLYKIKK